MLNALPPAAASLAYFCSTCGEVWERLSAGPTWQILTVPCAAHSPRGVMDWGAIPGSVVYHAVTTERTALWAQAACVEHLPPAIRRRELEVHLKYFYKEDAQ